MQQAKDVAAAIIVRDQRVLVTRRGAGQKMAGLWEFPGGKLEPGESAQQCIVRELAEELCITCEAGEVLIESLHHYAGGAINLIGVHVLMTCDTWQLSVHDEVRWMGPDELLTLDLAPADIPIAQRVCEILSDGLRDAE